MTAVDESMLAPLPGSEIVLPGLQALRESRLTEESLLVLMAAPNLRRYGIEVPDLNDVERPYEHRLYELLASRHGDAAHSRFNSLVRRLVSFERALPQLNPSSSDATKQQEAPPLSG